jgi:hypothetical protein
MGNVTAVSTPCDEWVGAHNGMGYGFITIAKVKVYAHRLAWMQDHGHTDLHMMHLCDNPRCINVGHLRPGTHAENMADSARKGRTTNQNKNKTECLNGHPFDESNTRITPQGERACRTCAREWMRAARARAKENTNAAA